MVWRHDTRPRGHSPREPISDGPYWLCTWGPVLSSSVDCSAASPPRATHFCDEMYYWLGEEERRRRLDERRRGAEGAPPLHEVSRRRNRPTLWRYGLERRRLM